MENALEAKGSLTETRLRRLLEAAQNERATGTLTLRQDGQQATSLYFLFGHLFHAVGGGGAGDDAVVQALAWSSGEFDFDAKAKLPPDESVRASIPDLIARANSESQGQAPAGPNGGRPQAWSPPGAQPKESQPAQSAQVPQPQQPYDRRSEQPYQRPGQSYEQQRSRGPEAEPTAPPEIRRGLKFRPVPKHGREPIPVPNGELMYDSLKTSFVDFPRLLTTLEREGYTGYVRLLADNATGLIYFREGTALEAVYDAGQDSAELGTEALGHFAQEVGRGQGVLDVVALAPDLVDGLYHVTVAQSVYTQLYAGWVDMHAFLRFLEERQLTGSLMVRSPAATGVIILDEGRLAGAYTSTAQQVANSTDGVLALCEDPNAMIEVKEAADERRPPLDLSQVVGQRQGGQNFGQPAATAPQPPPPTSSSRSRQYQPAGPAQRAPEAPSAPSYLAPRQPEPTPQQAPGYQQAAYAQPASSQTTAWPRHEQAQTATSGTAYEEVTGDLIQMTEEALGNRSRKIKDLLANAEKSRSGLEKAIDEIPQVSILFVDTARLESLANELRAKLQSYPA
ncbi:MAG: DUF4388 domain-containing protein [Candidatus Dormibacteraeota bacterium]|uniref:DUF4388 domain-containing protein n=1 Tax=Candidatus Dormiibacter inghamiae TaxID=3127013 RepID=A0A934KFT2_9BACT|nr:DUF4388 domain-containing protein [Candidatus Dormibacteraeota bacterium]MBJ7605699.1 DUF4388 domain-containing protein [Candidatus Dormibacteraeota bacterium]